MPRRGDEAKPDPIEVVVNYTIHPYFAISTDAAKLGGIRGVGETPLKALNNLRTEVVKRYPKGAFTLIEKITNPEIAGAWRMPESE